MFVFLLKGLACSYFEWEVEEEIMNLTLEIRKLQMEIESLQRERVQTRKQVGKLQNEKANLQS